MKLHTQMSQEKYFLVIFNLCYLLINLILIDITQSFLKSIPDGRKMVSVKIHVTIMTKINDDQLFVFVPVTYVRGISQQKYNILGLFYSLSKSKRLKIHIKFSFWCKFCTHFHGHTKQFYIQSKQKLSTHQNIYF